MIELLKSFELTTLQWTLVMACALMTGLLKAGLRGLNMIAIPLLAAIFGGRLSVGILLPVLISGDIFAVAYYNRHAEWKFIIRLLPWIIAGVLIGLLVGNSISDLLFKQIISVIILICLALLVWLEFRKRELTVPNHWAFSAVLGLAGGFTTMIGNAAGPIMTLYFLAMALPKNAFIGTGAWLFFIVNLFKVPLHIIFWKTITWQTLSVNLVMFPVVALGVLVGIFIVKYIPEKPYRWFVIVVTAAAGIQLLISSIAG